MPFTKVGTWRSARFSAEVKELSFGHLKLDMLASDDTWVMSFVHQLHILISIVHFLAENRELDILEILCSLQFLSFTCDLGY